MLFLVCIINWAADALSIASLVIIKDGKVFVGNFSDVFSVNRL